MKRVKKPLARLFRGRRYVVFLFVAAVMLGSGVMVAATLPNPITGSKAFRADFPADLRLSYAELVQRVRIFEDKQAKAHAILVSDRELQNMISQIQLDAASENYADARSGVKKLNQAIDNWTLELSGGSGAVSAGGSGTQSANGSSTPGAANGMFIPIVLYHYTPPNFDQQLTFLEQHGYTVIDLDEALAGMHGAPLPPKPVVLTFDDGFENQMQAFALLKKHNMKATFYIINGGQASKWCIGSGRRYGDPAQPAAGCGDAYLTWDQVRELDRSGLITIGGHTLDHENLASLTAEQQRQQIFDSKAGIEAEIGHPIRHFAYPYGAYNTTSISLAHEAGYVTAVTTLPGDYQPPGSEFTLRRVRETLKLP